MKQAITFLRRNALTGALLLAVCAISLITVVVVRTSNLTHQLATQQTTVAVQRKTLAATQRRLAQTTLTFEISQKASTETRVQTVTQRCDLTGLVLGVLVRVHDQTDSAPFEKSERTCLAQLASVKKINANTPTPH